MRYKKIRTLAFLTLAVMTLAPGLAAQRQSTKTVKPRTAVANPNAAKAGATPVEAVTSQKPFVSVEGGFSVVLPPGFAEPVSRTQTVTTPYGETIVLVMYESHPAKGNGIDKCLIAYVDYPARIFAESTPGNLLETAQRGMLNDLPQSKVIKDETFGWLPETGTRLEAPLSAGLFGTDRVLAKDVGPLGRSTSVSARDVFGTQYARFDVFLVEPRIYSILLSSKDRNALSTKPFVNFFESFRLVPKK